MSFDLAPFIEELFTIGLQRARVSLPVPPDREAEMRSRIERLLKGRIDYCVQGRLTPEDSTRYAARVETHGYGMALAEVLALHPNLEPVVLRTIEAFIVECTGISMKNPPGL